MISPIIAVPVLEINMTYPSDSYPIFRDINKNNSGILKTYNLKTFNTKVKRVRLKPLKKPAKIANIAKGALNESITFHKFPFKINSLLFRFLSDSCIYSYVPNDFLKAKSFLVFLKIFPIVTTVHYVILSNFFIS